MGKPASRVADFRPLALTASRMTGKNERAYSTAMGSRTRSAGVPAEAHIFANGPHGTGLGKGDAALDQWPSLLEIWLRAQGLLEAVRPAAKP